MVAVYIDNGISRGMLLGIKQAKNNGIQIEFRSLLLGVKLNAKEQFMGVQ